MIELPALSADMRLPLSTDAVANAAEDVAKACRSVIDVPS
jgi:hypothetical protein